MGSLEKAKIETRLFIDGQFVNSSTGKTFPCINPTNEEVICQVQEAEDADVDKAVQAARRAFHHDSPWRRMNGAMRRDLMFKLASLIERDSKELAELETLDNGKPLGDDSKHYGSVQDVMNVIKCIRYYAGHADKIMGRTIPVDAEQLVYTLREPVGVCAAIIPWNYPLLMFAWKICPALATGCTIVLKTSTKTPLSALAVCKLIQEAGFPKGVVNVVSGHGSTAGNRLIYHDDVDKVAFTGSTAVGKSIMKAAAESNLKKTSLELGGKSPVIVFDDCCIEEAVNVAHFALFMNMGQNCTAGSRLYVQSTIYEAFLEKLIEKTKRTKVGDPMKNDTDQGPLVDEKQFKKVMDYIKKGKDENATVAIGGSRMGDKGYFIEPTIFTGVKDHMSIAKEEIFGPVLVVMSFETYDEVIERANDTIYGLASGVCSRDVGKCVKVASALRAGTVWVNTYNAINTEQPFGGYKQSGIGRELGENGLNNYLETKTVVIPMGKSDMSS